MPAVSHLNDLLLEIPTRPQLWSEALDAVALDLEVQSISYGVALAHTYEPAAILWGTTRGVTSTVEREFQRKVFEHHPIVRWTFQAQPGDLLGRWQIDDARVHTHPAITEFENTVEMRTLQRRGGVAAVLATDDGVMAWLSFNRDRAHRRSLRDDLPNVRRSLHQLSRAAALHVALIVRERQSAMAEASIEAALRWQIVVDDTGAIVQESFVARSPWVGRRLVDFASEQCGLSASSSLALHQAVAKRSARVLVLEDKLANRRHTVTVSPLGPAKSKWFGREHDCLMVVGALKTPESDVLREALYGNPLMATLTPAELKIGQFLVQGKCAKEIARDLAVSVATVRTHIAHILDKTQSRSQRDFLRRLIAVPATHQS